MNHLVDNAIKFTDEGKITLAVKTLPQAIEITVEDTGRGLDKDAQECVFEKFYKENPSAEGTGIGLAICKHIVLMHKGKIWVESEGRRKGSRFKFTLPIAEERKEQGTNQVIRLKAEG